MRIFSSIIDGGERKMKTLTYLIKNELHNNRHLFHKQTSKI